jgi:hypothetical protein
VLPSRPDVNALRALLPLSLTLVACAGSPATRSATESARSARARRTSTWTGTVRFESRQPTATGASTAVTLRPARFVEVALVAGDGGTLATGHTDATGQFSLAGPRDAAAVEVRARLEDRGITLSVSPDPDGAEVHTLRVPVTSPRTPLEVTASDANPQGYAGAFHILDTAWTGLDAVRRWTGRTLPPLAVYWGRGVTTEWSYYRGERPARSGRYMLELLGGRPGQQATTDTDEHDEAIVLHEVGHFVMDMLSSNSSTGGSHPEGFLIDPGLAWEEGRATWFATAVRADPRYEDTIGIEGAGELRVNHNLEQGSRGPRGIGAESSVADVLWDLADGADGLPDADDDGVALGPAAVLQAMTTFRDEPGAYPSLGTFLRRIVTPAGQPGAAPNGGAPLLSRDALLAMLRRTREPVELVPATDAEDWPTNLAVPGRATGKVDGLTDPAPSGGRPRPANGFDALTVYRVHIPARAWLFVELLIEGPGTPQSRTDLDLELRDRRGEILTSARGTESRETLGRLLDAGYYYVYVRDGGRGNRALYELRTRTRVLGAPPDAPAAPTNAAAP